MKSPSRRLGRGLGAFLDFGPADEDGAARIEGVLSAADATSIIETSAEPVPRKHSPTETRTRRPAPPVAPPPAAPAAAAVVTTPAPTPEPVFVDDVLFVDEPVVVSGPIVVREPVAVVQPVAPPAPAPAPLRESAPVVDDSSLFVDDVVGGLAFPDVELE